MANDDKVSVEDQVAEPPREAWVKPEIVGFQPLSAAEGLGFNPTDGFANLS